MRKVLAAALSLGLIGATGPAPARADHDGDHDHVRVRHVLLISIDGMHAVNYLNCSKGISTLNNGAPYCPNLAALGETGVNYRDTSTSKPSDSFPGLMALVTGGSPRSVGAFYDVAYDRSLDAPITTTGNGVAGTGVSGCTPGSAPTGTTTEFDEGIDLNKLDLNGGASAGVDGGIQSIDPTKLERDPARNCAGVFPWEFVRTNTIFTVAHNFHRGSQRRTVHRLVRQTSVVLRGFRSRQRRQGRGRLILAGNQLDSREPSRCQRARRELQSPSRPKRSLTLECLDR
jgi:Type I phosphodiesterase / nucleotide pyrophosphatase